MTAQPAIADVIQDIQRDVKTIVAGEIELAKAELVPQAKKAGAGAGMLGGAGILALAAGTILNICMALVVSAILTFWLEPRWAYPVGFAIWAVLLLVIAGILALVAKMTLKFSKPQRTLESTERSVVAVRDAVESGQAKVKRMPLLGKREA